MPPAVLAAIAVVVLCGVLAGAFFAVSSMPLFVITTVQAEPSDHLSADEIGRLASIPQGATLLNVDEGAIRAGLQKNPWVKSVGITREFPDTLKITVEEREVFALVVMKSGSSVWYLSDTGVWIEPAAVSAGGSVTLAEAALAKATEEGCLLIQGVPSDVAPKAGSKATDAPILAVMDYQEGFSAGFAEQIVSYTAPSEAALSCVLKSGLEISLGSPTQIASKEAVITSLMAEHPNQLTFINVRNPSKPAYRKVQSDAVAPGSGVVTDAAQGDGTDAGQASGDGTDTSQATGDGTGADGSATGTATGGSGTGTATGGSGTGTATGGSGTDAATEGSGTGATTAG